jgi:ATP-dependent Clp protease ATP-binding subunit ClpA
LVPEDPEKPLADEVLFNKVNDGGTVRVLLDREADKLACEFVRNADGKPKALPLPKKPKAEESV